MAKLIFLFLDGVGIGKAGPTNPFFAAQAAFLPFYEGGCTLPDQTPVKPIDAQLGVAGMPMSATGQTSLFTGTNLPALLGEHRESYPDRAMREVIKEKNLFSLLRKHHKKPRFLNVFPGSHSIFTPEHIYIRSSGEFYQSPTFLAYYKRPLSVTTCMMIANHMSPFGKEDIKRERALYHDFSNLSLKDADPDLPCFEPEQAAEIIYRTSRDYDLLLYEYFQTDLFGHGFGSDDCLELVAELDRLVGRLISLLDGERDTLLLTSDHGNLEDLDTPMHTGNPVPLLAWGHGAESLRRRIDSLADVNAGVLDLFLDPD
jgi:hypothetical protein